MANGAAGKLLKNEETRMRPQQQNRRMRGRGNNNNNNNNRKGPNPLTRNYESNGPDVKIRGSAQQIAEKYTTLARDAMSAGDRVIAENYLQHAEHYNRIIAAALAQQGQHMREARDDFEDGDDDRDDMEPMGFEAPQPQPQPAQQLHGTGPQPVIEGVPAEVALETEVNGRGEERGERRFNGQPQQAPVNGEQANGAHAANGGQDEGVHRRPRRPRRGGRGRGDQQEIVDEAGETGGREIESQPAPIEASSDEAPIVVADS
jgi:hypothetical protein